MDSVDDFIEKLKSIRRGEYQKPKSVREFVLHLDDFGVNGYFTLEQGKRMLQTIPFLHNSKLDFQDCWCDGTPKSSSEVLRFLKSSTLRYSDDSIMQYNVVKFIESRHEVQEDVVIRAIVIAIDHEHSTFAELDNWNLDEIVYVGKKYCATRRLLDELEVVKEVIRGCTIALTEQPEFITLFKPCNNPYKGMGFIPDTAEILPGMLLENIKSYVCFTASEDNEYTLSVKGKSSITADVPIITSSEVTIKGAIGSILILQSIGEKQPCIGPVTCTGMTDGYWEKAGQCPSRIIIDGVEVICHSKVPNFTIGQYGSGEMPDVVLLNGGKLICPEMDKKRVVSHWAKPPFGSTVVCESMEYTVVGDGETPVSMLKDQELEILDKICMYNQIFYNTVTYATSKKSLEKALEVLTLVPNADVSLMLSGEYENVLSTLRTVAILKLNPYIVELGNTAVFESYKCTTMCYDLFYGVGNNVNIYNLIYYINEKVVLTDYIIEVMYELIPVHDWEFYKHVTHLLNVRGYLRLWYGNYDKAIVQKIHKCKDRIAEYFGLTWRE